VWSVAEEPFFVVSTQQEGEALQVASQMADAVGGVAREPGERSAQLVVAGVEPVIDELQQFGEFGDVSGGELDAGFGFGHRRAPSGPGCCGAELSVGGREIVAELLVLGAQLGDLVVGQFQAAAQQPKSSPPGPSGPN
jgi:hypothetical protein